MREIGHLHQAEEFPRLGMALGLADAAHLQAEGHIVEATEMREQRVALEHHRRTALHRRQFGHVLTPDQDVPGRDRLMPRDHPQRRGFAAARRPQQAAIAGGGDAQRNLIHGQGGAVALADRDQLYIEAIVHLSGFHRSEGAAALHAHDQHQGKTDDQERPTGGQGPDREQSGRSGRRDQGVNLQR